jgi:ABC-type branched-subunit amino acid transport system ATPase component
VLRKNGLTPLLVEQNALKSLSISDRPFVLELGRNCFTSSGEALLVDSRVRQLYLGG